MKKAKETVRTLKQNRIIHSLVNKWQFTPDDKAQLVFDITKGRTETTKELTIGEADVMIERLGGKVSVSTPSSRTIRYNRQRGGVPQIITPQHEKLMLDLAKQRNISQAGLERMCRRMLQKSYPRTTKDCNKIIEALKAMNKRDPKPQPGNGTKEAA